MKSMTPLRAVGTLVLFVLGTIGLNGCNEIEDTVAVVYVQNSLGAPVQGAEVRLYACLLYTSPSPRDRQKSRMPSSA